MNLPKGVWFEGKRNRFRVRLYAKGHVEHLSYHKTLEEALDIMTIENEARKNNDAFKRMYQKTRLYFKQSKYA